MTKVLKVINSDAKIWNLEEVILTLANSTDSLTIDLNSEGPCIKSLGLLDLMLKSNATHIKLKTSNMVEDAWTDIEYQPSMQYVLNTRNNSSVSCDKDKHAQKFGMFIGRSNFIRLFLASKLQDTDILLTFHYDNESDYHKDNLGLDRLVQRYGIDNLYSATKLLSQTPIVLDQIQTYPILSNQHLGVTQYYKNFYIEVVCLTYFTGKTFFPDEKIWRPIQMKTPFIVQGPQNFLSNLKRMGFKTFDRWWDEGYSEDPYDHQPIEIIKVIEHLNNKSAAEIYNMYIEMHTVLEHNYQTLQSLSYEDYLKAFNEQ